MLLPCLMLTAAELGMAEPKQSRSSDKGQVPVMRVFSSAYPPFLNGDGQGLVERVVSESFARQDILVEFSYLPRKRARHAFLSNPDSLFVGVVQKLDEQSLMAIHLARYARSFVVRSDSPHATVDDIFASLNGKTVGVGIGSSMKGELIAKGLDVQESSSLNNLFKMVLSQRIAAVYIPHSSALELIRRDFSEYKPEFAFHHFAFNSISLIAQPETSGRVSLDKFSEGLQQIIDDGSYQTIMQQYFGEGEVPSYLSVKGAEIRRLESAE